MNYPWKGAASPMSPRAFARAAERLGCEVAAVKAVWDVESSGDGFKADGSVKDRYEPHHFPDTGFNWRQSLNLPTFRRTQMFIEAYRKDPEAAMRATSWGGPQIMGFNCEAAGFASARAMVEAMAAGADAHLEAFVTLVQSWRLDGTLRAHDWFSFATRYNGSGQAPVYARKIEAAYRRHSGEASPVVLRVGARGRAVKQLQRALGIADDGVFGPDTEARVRAFQMAEGLKVDGVVGKRTWDAIEAKTEAVPQRQPTQADDLAGKVTKAGSLAAAVSGILASVRDTLPEGAFVFLAYGAVALALIAGGAFLVRWVRRTT